MVFVSFPVADSMSKQPFSDQPFPDQLSFSHSGQSDASKRQLKQQDTAASQLALTAENLKHSTMHFCPNCMHVRGKVTCNMGDAGCQTGSSTHDGSV